MRKIVLSVLMVLMVSLSFAETKRYMITNQPGYSLEAIVDDEAINVFQWVGLMVAATVDFEESVKWMNLDIDEIDGSISTEEVIANLRRLGRNPSTKQYLEIAKQVENGKAKKIMITTIDSERRYVCRTLLAYNTAKQWFIAEAKSY